MSTMSSQEFNRQPTSVKRQADQEPVYITERGEPAYVVVSIEEYRRLRGTTETDLASYLRSDEFDDYDLPSVEVDVPGAAL